MKRLKLVFWLVVLSVGLVAVPTSMHAAPFAYIGNYENQTVKVIDTADYKVVDAIAVGWHPHSFAIHPDGKTVYMAGEYDIDVIDACTNKVVATIDSDYVFHTGVAVHPSGSNVYFTSAYGGADPSDYNVSVVDTSTNEVTATIPIDDHPSDVAVHPSGETIYVSHAEGIAVINTNTNMVTTTIEIDGPLELAFHPSGSPLYAAGVNNTVAVINTTTNEVTDRIDVGASSNAIAVHPTGALVYVTNRNAMTVSMINTATNTVTITQDVWSDPNGIAVHPSGDTIYVPIGHQSWVQVHDSSTLELIRQVQVGQDPVAHGFFIGPEITCEENELEQCQEDLAAAGQTISALETTIASQEAVINSFLTYVFGASADANVAEAARNMTRETIDQATANVGANDRRVRLAERFFDRGVAALAAQDFRRAMSLFQTAFRFAQQAL